MLKKQTVSLCALILALVTLGVATLKADDKKDLAETSKTSFGTFRLVSKIEDGKPIDKEEFEKVRLTLSDGKWVATVDEETVGHGTFKVVGEKDGVRQVEGKVVEGENAGKVNKHISKQEGERLIICYAPEGKDFPTKFESKPGEGYTLSVWERVKK